MTEITELDTETVERIAAGEVVTRPANVVTELVENALDAGAETIEIEVENSGLDLIRVTDDGHGMTEEDALLAVERHTTSKIGDVSDVSRIETLGFRGEALPSISHVAHLELTTKAEESGVAGTRVVVDGKEKTARPAGRAVGTTVSVTDLFANVPARRKSLAQPKQEFSRVSSAVSGYALTHPEVRFSLTHDGRTVLSTPGSGSDTDAVLGIYDREVAGQSTEFEYSMGNIRVNGLVVYPAVTRASPAHVTTAVNGRTLRDATIRNAVENGYGSLLPDGRHPIAVITVEAPPKEVDINIHPSKAEVGFHDADAVEQAVERAVSEALSTESLERTANLDFDRGAIDEADESAFDSVGVIGGFRDLYLLCEADDDLLVVDQHAAHERINFERLRAALDNGGSGSGGVIHGRVESVEIEPTTLSLTAAEAALVESHEAKLGALGFRIESDGSYRVTEVPAPLGRVAEAEAIHDVLDALLAGEEPADPREELLRELACHPSLKAGDALSGEDATRLVRRLGACEQPFACPHGRPTVLRIDEATFARSFERPNTRFD
jgi:DNA mismatch repair protein MutL